MLQPTTAVICHSAAKATRQRCRRPGVCVLIPIVIVVVDVGGSDKLVESSSAYTCTCFTTSPETSVATISDPLTQPLRALLLACLPARMPALLSACLSPAAPRSFELLPAFLSFVRWLLTAVTDLLTGWYQEIKHRSSIRRRPFLNSLEVKSTPPAAASLFLTNCFRLERSD